jgi:hypothetical protein
VRALIPNAPMRTKAINQERVMQSDAMTVSYVGMLT